jgi:hypothetical protein
MCDVGAALVTAAASDATVCATIHTCKLSGTPPIGRAMANVRIYLLDALGRRHPWA